MSKAKFLFLNLSLLVVVVAAAASCEDTRARFKFEIDGKTETIECKYVREENPDLCSNKRTGMEKTCPSTCNACDNCKDSPLEFEVKRGKKRKFATCDEFLKKKKNKKCRNARGVKEICRKTCGECSSSSYSPVGDDDIRSLVYEYCSNPEGWPSTKDSTTYG